jgi:hypothetical protein
MAVVATSVTFAAGTPKRTLNNLGGNGATVIRCWVVSPVGLRIGDDATLTVNNGLPVLPNQVNLFEFASTSNAGTTVSLVRENTGPDFVIHIMTEIP